MVLIAFAGVDARAGSDLPPPLTDANFLHDGAPDPVLVDLGRDLFFDPILSGNRNISCGTCHDPARGTGDGLALSFGEGGAGFGPGRRSGTGITGRVPRNAQPLYNIGAREYASMFHDGRLEPDPANTFVSGFWSPAREDLPEGLDSLLAAQAMFPVLSPVEMAGVTGSNPVATAVADDRVGDAWDLLADRLRALADYAAGLRPRSTASPAPMKSSSPMPPARSPRSRPSASARTAARSTPHSRRATCRHCRQRPRRARRCSTTRQDAAPAIPDRF